MNQTKVKYALGRIDQIYGNKKKQLKEKHALKGKSITGTERLRLLKDGIVKVKKNVTRAWDTSEISDIFDFSDYEWVTKDSQALAPALAKLEKEYYRIKDEIVLGDEEVAMRLIAEFSKEDK